MIITGEACGMDVEFDACRPVVVVSYIICIIEFELFLSGSLIDILKGSK